MALQYRAETRRTVIDKLSRFWKILLFFPLTGNGGGEESDGRARIMERIDIKGKSG